MKKGKEPLRTFGDLMQFVKMSEPEEQTTSKVEQSAVALNPQMKTGVETVGKTIRPKLNKTAPKIHSRASCDGEYE